MAEIDLLSDLVVAIVAAFVGGLVAQRLRLPVILGYLLAGMAIGPAALGAVSGGQAVRVISEIGVAFLMFALGAEFSPAELRRLGLVMAAGGVLQIALTTLVGAGLGLFLLGLDTAQSLLLGALLALSSTVVAMKLLEERGEGSSLVGRLTMGFAIVQDLAVVPLVILLPALAGSGEFLARDLGLTVLKAAALLLVTYVVGTRLVPLLLERTAMRGSREMFLLATVSLALGTAAAADAAGLSLAFGAFLAGLVVADSDYAPQVVAEVLPLRDLFASLFFVSVGMLVDPAILAGSLRDLVPLVLVATVGKIVIVAGVALALGMPSSVAIMSALTLGQVGEFSFVLARLGVDRGALPERVFDLVLGTAVVSIALTPALIQVGPALLAGVRRVPLLSRAMAEPNEGPTEGGGRSTNHAVVCGFGRVGQELAQVLLARGISLQVIEYNPRVVSNLRAAGIAAIYGDAANPAVLGRVHLERARVLAVTLPDPQAAERIVRLARSQNPRLDIVARGQTPDDLERLRKAGASDVVQPEFEGGLEFIRHTMRRYGVLGTELQSLVAGRRIAYYQHAPEDER